MFRRPCLTLGLLAIMSGLAAPVAAAPGPCPASGKMPVVNLTVLDGGVFYDFTKTARQIATISGLRSPGQVTRGLTSTKFRSGYSVAFEQVKVRDGVCLYPVAIEAKIGYDPMTVYVEKKYDRDSCQFRVIMQHEQQHVRVNQETLKAFVPRVRAALIQAATGSAFPIYAAEPRIAKSMGMGEIGAAFDREVTELSRQREQLNAQLDSPASYRASQAICNRW